MALHSCCRQSMQCLYSREVRWTGDTLRGLTSFSLNDSVLLYLFIFAVPL